MSEEMRLEWEAWRAFCVEFGKLPPTPRDANAINDPRAKPILDAARVWGERLVSLRLTQDKAVVAKALKMALEGRP